MQPLAIILMCVGASVVYGILHNQVTARICVEYFTIGHPPIFPTSDPTLLAIGWGIVATWWVGVLLGVPLAWVARAGNRPPRSASSLVVPVVVLMVVTGCCAVVSGIVGWMLANNGNVVLLEPLASHVPRERHVPFLADLWAHSASYLAGFLGGVVLLVCVWRSRGRAASQRLAESPPVPS